jgi:hypothetical protein
LDGDEDDSDEDDSTGETDEEYMQRLLEALRQKTGVVMEAGETDEEYMQRLLTALREEMGVVMEARVLVRQILLHYVGID